MLGLLFIFSQLAWGAGGWWLESPATADRAAAEAIEAAAERSGYTARVVKRFKLGDGWMHVALVEGFADEASASSASTRLRKETGKSLVVLSAPAKGKPARPEEAAAPVAAKPAAPSAAAVAARCVDAHGGASGGVAVLARVPVVHFRFTREFTVDAKTVRVKHDYWRTDTARRLVIAGGGFGTDSVLVATDDGAWLSANGKSESRDIGVMISQADAFSPEVVLGPALDPTSLFEGTDPGTLMLLEGAESGLRVGRGEDPERTGVAFADVDASTGMLRKVRYVTDAGPITFSYDGWSSVREGLFVPRVVRVERWDGRNESITVETMELPSAAPSGTFTPP